MTLDAYDAQQRHAIRAQVAHRVIESEWREKHGDQYAEQLRRAYRQLGAEHWRQLAAWRAANGAPSSREQG